MGQDRVGMLQQALPVRRRPHAGRPALEQRYAVFGFQGGDVTGDSRLRVPERA
jgi:hypothetical protein